jgi:RNA polymerase sigma factor (TIGR02999 family)
VTRPDPDQEITRLLNRRTRSNAEEARLYESVYEELRRTAGAVRARWSGNETLSATALVHEAWMRLDGGTDPDWDNRKHFYVVAARAMRQILLNYAERARAAKRLPPAVTDDVAPPLPGKPDEILALHEALERLEAHNPRHARVVELRFFADLSYDEIAEQLEISVPTAKRDWAFARSLLARWLDPDTPDDRA